MQHALLPFLCGAAAGVLSAWGIGGGTLLLLCMTLFLGVDQAEAQGINLLFFLPTAGLSLLYHRKNGFLDRAALRSAAPVGTACALVAALISSSVELAILRKPFGLFLIYAGVTLLLPAKPHKRGAAQ